MYHYKPCDIEANVQDVSNCYAFLLPLPRPVVTGGVTDEASPVVGTLSITTMSRSDRSVLSVPVLPFSSAVSPLGFCGGVEGTQVDD